MGLNLVTKFFKILKSASCTRPTSILHIGIVCIHRHLKNLVILIPYSRVINFPSLLVICNQDESNSLTPIFFRVEIRKHVEKHDD